MVVVTGTDTGVGKTVLTVLLARHLRKRGLSVAALKPVSSGSRSDARALRAALAGLLTLDEINPWHFRAPLAPLVAARMERRRVLLSDVLKYLRSMRRRFDILLVEGAGGLLSPLGEGFNTRDLIVSLRADAIIVCPNRLGAVNQCLLAHSALPSAIAARSTFVLMEPPGSDAATRSNPRLLAECLNDAMIQAFPRVRGGSRAASALQQVQVRRALARLAGWKPPSVIETV